MKRIKKGKGLHKATAILLTAIMVLSTFAVLPADLFKVSAAETTTSERLELDFNNNWKFNLGDASGAYAKVYDDSAWETVELPHDFSITQEFFSSGVEAESGNLPGGTGWYRKMFVMPAEYRDKTIILNFDGAYKDTYVYVNGKLVGENHYGYNSFSFDISEYLVCNGEIANFIAVKVENQLPSSRWYSGSGIYRDVTLTVVDLVHVDLYGTYVTTPNLADSNGTDGTVNAVVTLDNDASYNKTVTVETKILDATGAEVGTSASAEVTTTAGEQIEVTLTPALENPELWNSWDLGTPYLYTLRTTVYADGTAIDVYDTDLGYRWFNWDADTGFSLNGTNVKLEGVCMHHDQGSLGSVQVYDAIYRQVSILKDMGCNAIRTSHGTPSDVFMDVCNELGMLVMNEFFDGWSAYKNSNTNDFGAYFEETIDTSANEILNAEDGQMWYEFVITQSVKRDRNDPAVVIWDVGNELTESASGDTSDYGTIGQAIQELIDELDPTRPICQGSNGPSNSVLAAVDEFMDVIGGNYNTSSWISVMTSNSDDRSTKPYVGTETASATSTRGVYDTLSHYSYVCSAYDTDSVSWGAQAAAAWYNTIAYDWNSGEFVWTGFDYIGEPTHWNHATGTYGEGSPSSSYFGIIDTAGFAKDTYYLYRSLWNEHSTTLHLVPGTWDSSELAKNGNYTYVAVYSNADHIELLGDGNVIAKAQSTATSSDSGNYTYQTWTETVVDSSNVNTTEFYTGDGNDLYSQFQVNYSAYSTISVKAYDASGNEITDAVGTKSVSNTTATNIVASTWADASTAYTADGDSYIYIEYEAQDADGNFDSTYNGTLTITLNGNEAEIVGVDNGDPSSSEKFQQSSVVTSDNTATIQMFNGKALVVLRTNEEIGDVEVTTTDSSGITVNGVTVSAVAETGDDLTDEFEEVTDQSNVVYEPTIYDKYDALYDKITAGATTAASNEYVEYTAGNVNANVTVEEMTSTDNNSFSNGWYIITGVADYASFSEGAMTHTTSGSGFHTDGTTIGTVPEATTDSWYFERQSDGTFYIYYEDSTGTKRYLNLSSSNATASTTPQALEVVVSSSGVTIGTGSGSYLNYSGGESDVAGVWTAATSLTLYKVLGQVSTVNCPVENGIYVIYNNDSRTGDDYSDGILSGRIEALNTTQNGIPIVITAPSNNIITTESENAYTFTLVDGTTDEYYIQNYEGKYLSIGSSGGSVSFSDTATSVNVYARDDGSVFIYNADSSQFLDHWYNSTQDHYSTWSSTISATDVNRIFVLYKNESTVTVPAGKEDLYNSLQEGIEYAPGTYSTASYTALFEALEAGYEVFEDDAATDEEITNATAAINEAIAGLEMDYKYFPSTIYKYGYNPDSSTPYSQGGIPFNAQTYASMEEIIRADDNLMSQIKEVIGYDTESWNDGEADTALDTAVTAYAKIYSISFTGGVVANGTRVSDFYKTAWNAWCKTGTQGANETSEEGASVQGLFSALLVNGAPVDHAVYDELPYGNAIDNENRADFNTIEDGFSITITVGGTVETVALPNLEGVSVHINELFSKENILIDSTDTTQGYSKYYWDLQFPFITTTNEYGINTFEYSSSSSEYMFQAEYNDDEHTATAQLSTIEDWSINRDSKDAGTGFFPFNYKIGVSDFTGENAIYHFGMTFTTDFYIPVSGTYADGEDVVFEFSGDDDVLVYIDDVLVLDNGGLHGARAASVNFTDASVSYQYAMDVEDSYVESTTENAITYAYGASNADLSGDELAALRKLNEVRTDGEYHTFTFYYLERGSTDSNCEIKFNLQQASEHVLLNDQTLVLDYGLPVEYYYVQSNDTITEEGEQAEITYLGVLDANVEINSVVTFSDPENLSKTFADNGDTLVIDGLKYGEADMTEEGYITYKPTTLQMTGRDFFYFCASIYNDPTYAEGTTYYQYERVNFVPATTIYYEDNYAYGLTFKDGSIKDDTNNDVYGKWTTVGDESLFEGTLQSADLSGGSNSNPYGFDDVYAPANENDTKDYTQFSGFSAHKVTVNANNNTKNGGTNPTFEFEFTGIGFDVISVTDNTTGVFYVEIFDENGDQVGKRKVVDTYYGYAYGQLYADENGEATLTVTDAPLYKSEKDAVTSNVKYYTVDGTAVSNAVTYYDVSGTGYTETPTYYDADGNLTTDETENPAYAYAYAFGWVENADSEGIYQIPVIKINGLDYGTYTVVITPMYTAMFDHNGSGEFNLYVDAIRIYHPAETDADNFIHQAYRDDDELHPHYLEIKDVLIGADSLSKAEQQGVIFIDGIAALDNDLEKYKVAGPNNELYLASGQAVAFEIWASAVPSEVQLGVKSVQGEPKLKITFGDKYGEKAISTATEMNYTLNSILPSDGLLTWTRVVVNGVTYYKTDTIVLQNAEENGSILSLTSMKWTFTNEGQYGHYELQDIALISTDETVLNAYSMMRAQNQETDGDEDVVPETPVEPETPVTPETPVVSDDTDNTVTDNNTEESNGANENNVANGNTSNNTNSTNANVNTESNSASEANKAVVNEPITVTVTTSTGVTELIIRDENGNVITPEELECTIKTIDNKEVKVWTITLTESESGTYTYSVIGEFADGTVEEQEEITVTVTAPEEDEGFFAKLAGFFEDIVKFFKNLIAKIDIA